MINIQANTESNLVLEEYLCRESHRQPINLCWNIDEKVASSGIILIDPCNKIHGKES